MPHQVRRNRTAKERFDPIDCKRSRLLNDVTTRSSITIHQHTTLFTAINHYGSWVTLQEHIAKVTLFDTNRNAQRWGLE